MKAKISPGRFLLLTSLAVNLAFAFGYLNAAIQKKWVSNRGGRIKIVMKKLNLTPEQALTFRRLHTEANQAAIQFHKAVKKHQAAFWEELGKETPDQKKLFSYLRETQQETLIFNKRVTDLLLQFIRDLTPEQRAKFIAFLRKRRLYSGRFIMSGR